MKIANTVWIVTGGGSGLGRELVLQLLQRGARVAAVDLRADALAETSALARAGERMSTHVADITDRAACAALVADVIAAHGAIDGIINNAGIIQKFVPVAELGYDNIDRVLAVNLMGTITMVKEVLPVLLARPRAHIANVSSMGGDFPFPGQSVYSASKAGVKLFTEGLYAELLDTGVSVSLITPGKMGTQIAEHSDAGIAAGPGTAQVKTLPPETAARIALDGLERDRLHIFLGRDARMFNLAVRVAPGPAIRFISKQMKKMLARTGAMVDQ